MSSPHLGGDFLSALNRGGGGGGRGSGRSTPIVGSLPRAGLHSHLRTGGAGGASDSEDDEIQRSVGWRAITPSRSPRTGGSDSPVGGVKVPIRGPSSRNPEGIEDLHLLQAAYSAPVPVESLDASFDSSAAMGVHPHDLREDTSGDSSFVVPPAADVRFATLPPVLKGYLLGQIACVVKFGVWWVGFTYLLLALFNGSSYLVGATRIAFNLALLLCSPIAGAFADQANIKKLLNRTVIGRGLIYCVFIPATWLLMESGLLYHIPSGLHSAFYVIFLLLIFLDGIDVSFSNVADIDSGGVNLVAAQYGIELDDNVRNYFNSLHVLFFDLSMVVFNPIIAYIGLVIGERTMDHTEVDGPVHGAIDELTMLIAIGGVFLISSIFTILFYNAYMPDINLKSHAGDAHLSHSMQNFTDAESPALTVGVGVGPNSLNASPDYEEDESTNSTITWAQFKELALAVREGASLTWSNTRIRWRVLFFAIETSVEDAMIALIAAEIGSDVFADKDHSLHYAWGQLWGAGLVAVGKSGGVLASVLMHRYFTVDPSSADDAAYRPLFWFAFIGGSSSLLLPLAYHLRTHDIISVGGSSVLIFVAMFLFFLFSTLAKIGFSTLMQSMAAEVEATGKVFGFVAAFVTAVDALILMALAALFAAVDLQLALWIGCGGIAVHGLVELLFGPALVLKKRDSLDDQLRMDLAESLM